MIEQFEKLSAVEREKILEVCIKEFGEKGYERASTNSIVQNADIPKGTLFYFFGSKKKLFLYLVDYTVARYVAFVDEYLEGFPHDLFDRLLYLFEVRMHFAVHSPHVYRFFFRTLLNIPDELKADMKERFRAYAEGNRNLMQEDLDISGLREGVTVDQAMELLSTIVEGQLSRHMDIVTNMEAEESLKYVENLLAQSADLFDLLKRGLYADR